MQVSVIVDPLRSRFDFTKSVIWASLSHLVSKACPAAAATNMAHTYCWNVLPPCPYFSSSIPHYSGNHGNGYTNVDLDNVATDSTSVPLLVIGGHSGLQLSVLGELGASGLTKDIYAYNGISCEWIRIGELPEEAGCSCSLLPSGELFVAGGQFRSPLNSVHIGRLQK